MNRPYRLVVFDWEGTLGDTLGQILNTVAVEAKQLQFGEFDQSQARNYVVLGLVSAVQKMFPHLTMHQHEQLLSSIQSALLARPTEVTLFPGAKRLVEQIEQAGMMLAIATNKGQQSLLRNLQATELEAYFAITRTAGQAAPKPCSQMLEEIIEACGVQTSETLMVGDSVTDIEMARHIGVDAVGVDFYHQNTESLRSAGALEVFDEYEQLASFLGLKVVL